jgi:hypothetical protein
VQGIAAGEKPASNGLRLSAELQAAREDVEARFLPALTHVWERIIRDAGAAAAEQFALVAAADWQPPAEGAALTALRLAALAEALKRGASPIWRKILLEIARGPIGRIGIAWDVKHPLFAGQLEKAAQRTGVRLGEAVQPILRKTIATAYEGGLGVPETAALIRSEISAAAPWQADMLARTDLNSLANGASKAAASLTGMQFKTWIATMDDKTRPEHADADGQTVPINDPFDVGGEDADYPGDPALSDAMAANCRCTLAYGETLDEAEALLADGGTTMAKTTHRQRAKRNSRVAAERRIKQRQAAEALVAGAVAVHHTAVVEGTWDGNAAMGRCSSAADYRSICAAFENGADLSQRQAWHLPHHANPNGPANINGVRNALARAPQTTSISAADRAGATNHLRAHLNDYNRRQGNDAIEGLDTMTLEDALAAMDEAWGPAELVEADAETFEGNEVWERAAALAAGGPKLPAGMDSMPDGVRHCQMNGTPGYSGGGACHMHNGSQPSMQRAMRQAQADARRAREAIIAATIGAPAETRWVSDLAFEGTETDDKRYILPNALDWRDLPLTLMAMTETGPGGHEGAFVAGKIDKVSKDRKTNMDGEPLPDGVVAIRGQGMFDMGGEGGAEIARLVNEEIVQGISIDMAIHEIAFRNPETGEVIQKDDAALEDVLFGDLQLAVQKGTILAATVCPTPAFAAARIALAASADGSPVIRLWAPFKLEQAITASAAPAQPPRAWFETPEPPGKMPLTVNEDGRVFGHIATWDSCHVGFLPQCVPPPKSTSSYAYFHVCELDTADGDPVTVGKLMFSPTDGGHADRALSAAKASAYYDRTGMAAAFLRVSDGEHGIWAAGVLNPNLSDEQRQEMRRQLRLHPPSGDWRPINGQYELICALAVAVPGYPTPRATVTITAAGDEIVLEDAIIASSGIFEPDPQALDALEQIGLVDDELQAERQMGELVNRATWRDKLSEILKGDR